jgi:ubiquinone/menaquinone biosynthesis C-methylase UbiE
MFHPRGPTFFELARQALSSTQKGYDLLAPKFDYTPFRTPGEVLDAVGAHLAQTAPYNAGLDLCCGTGAGVALLRPLCRERVVGLDFSQGMLEVCRRQTDVPGSAELDLVGGDALALPFAQAFDVVVCFGALGHILPRHQPGFAAEVARVLRPGGRFAFVTSFMPPFWSRGYWVSRLFNGAMHVRNWLVRPPFIMYYLTFLLPQAEVLLRRQGLTVEVRELGLSGEYAALRLVIAQRPL